MSLLVVLFVTVIVVRACHAPAAVVVDGVAVEVVVLVVGLVVG